MAISVEKALQLIQAAHAEAESPAANSAAAILRAQMRGIKADERMEPPPSAAPEPCR